MDMGMDMGMGSLEAHREESLREAGLGPALGETAATAAVGWSALSTAFDSVLATLAWTNQSTL